jgi:chromosome segregation ATPase
VTITETEEAIKNLEQEKNPPQPDKVGDPEKNRAIQDKWLDELGKLGEKRSTRLHKYNEIITRCNDEIESLQDDIDDLGKKIGNLNEAIEKLKK